MTSVRARMWGLAAICAAWVVAWPLLALESTRGLRGILGLSRDRGAYDLLALVYTGHESVVYAALFLASLVLFRAMLGVAFWFDRDRRALDALRWALDVRSVRAGFVVVLVFLFAMSFAPERWRDALWIAAWCFFLLALVVSRFAVGCPTTLVRDRDVGGWRLYWPGAGAVLVIAALWLISDLGLKLLAGVVADGSGAWMQAAMQAIVLPVEFALGLLGAAIWFGYRRGASLVQAWAALRRGSFLRAYLGSGVYGAVVACLLAAPILVVSLISIFIAPHYSDLMSTEPGALPWLLQRLDRLGQGFRADGWGLVLLPLMIWIGFADNRLIFRDGLGDRLGPDAPSR